MWMGVPIAAACDTVHTHMREGWPSNAKNTLCTYSVACVALTATSTIRAQACTENATRLAVLTSRSSLWSAGALAVRRR